MRRPLAILDVHLHADGLSDDDLRSMAFFGLAGALVPARDAVCPRACDLVSHFEGLIHGQARRFERLGLVFGAALGVHPARIPWHGLEQVLAAIPRLAIAGRLLAIGEVGLERGGAREEQVFARQLELARELGLPVLVHTPERDKLRLTRRVLAVLRESAVPQSAVLVDHVDASTLRLVRGCGYRAGLTVNPMRLRAEDAVELVAQHGSDGIALSSDAGDGARDILSLARTASLLEGRKVPEAVIRRVLDGNARAFLKLDRPAASAAAPTASRQKAG